MKIFATIQFLTHFLQMKVIVLFAMVLCGAAVAQNEDRALQPPALASPYRKAEDTLKQGTGRPRYSQY
jgi:hypothetical protein